MASIELRNRPDLPGDKFELRLDGTQEEFVELLTSAIRKSKDFKMSISISVLVVDKDLVYELLYLLQNEEIYKKVLAIREKMRKPEK